MAFVIKVSNMPKYYINDFEVHENDYKLYINKEFKRVEARLRDCAIFKYLKNNKATINDIKFEMKESD